MAWSRPRGLARNLGLNQIRPSKNRARIATPISSCNVPHLFYAGQHRWQPHQAAWTHWVAEQTPFSWSCAPASWVQGRTAGPMGPATIWKRESNDINYYCNIRQRSNISRFMYPLKAIEKLLTENLWRKLCNTVQYFFVICLSLDIFKFAASLRNRKI